MNQALFEYIEVGDDGDVTGTLAGPYRQLLDPTLVVAAEDVEPGRDEQSAQLPGDDAAPAVRLQPDAWHDEAPTSM